MGVVRAICISEKRGIQKSSVQSARLVVGWGIENDAHGGDWHRQVSLLSGDKVDEFNKRGANVSAGEFAENILVDGFDFRNLPVGTIFQCGDALLEMTQIGKECHTHCQIYKKMGDCIMPREGVFAKVVNDGVINVGDEMTIVPQTERKRQAAVVTLSDKGSKNERTDESGPLIARMLSESGFCVAEEIILPDEKSIIEKELIRLSDGRQVDLILTTGGTGFSPRDITPEATLAVADRNAPGISEAIRAHSLQITKRAMLSRAVSVLRGKTLIINLPGSPKAVSETLEYILPELEHGLAILRSEAGECAR